MKPIDLAEIGDRYMTVSRLTSLMLRSSCEDTATGRLELPNDGPCWQTCGAVEAWCPECVRRNEAYHLRKKARQLNAAVSSYKRSESRRARRST